jgi:hypothetical protein
MTDKKQKNTERDGTPMLSALPDWGTATTRDRLAIPEHPGLTEAIGRVTIAHTHLELILRYTVKTLAGLSVKDALDATQGERISDIRRRIRRLFAETKPTDSELIRLDALLGAARRLSEKRNTVLHSAWSETPAHQAVMKGEDYRWNPAPSNQEVNALTDEILVLVKKINDARLRGFLYEATKRRKRRTSGGN